MTNAPGSGGGRAATILGGVCIGFFQEPCDSERIRYQNSLKLAEYLSWMKIGPNPDRRGYIKSEH